MPSILQMPGGVPVIGAPYVVKQWLVVVTIECRQCDAHPTITLTNQQPAACPACGASYQCGGLLWDSSKPGRAGTEAQVAIAASTPQKADS